MISLANTFNIEVSDFVFDWCTKKDLPQDFRVLEIERRYFLNYDYRSTGETLDAWEYSNSTLRQPFPVFTPGKLKLITSIHVKYDAKKMVALLKIVDLTTKQSVLSKISVWEQLVVSANNDIEIDSFIDLNKLMNASSLQHGERYRAYIKFVSYDVSENIVEESWWLESAHILHVNVQAPIAKIISPKLGASVVDSENEAICQFLVSDQASIVIEIETSEKSEVLVKDDYLYPDNDGLVSTDTSRLLDSSDGLLHRLVIANPDPSETNGVRFSFAARDVKYKNISPSGWGHFCYNILFNKKEVVRPELELLDYSDANFGHYYDINTIFKFSGIHSNATAIKVELWQNSEKKVSAPCLIVNNEWIVNLPSLINKDMIETEILVKIIATSHTGDLAEVQWNASILLPPDISITQPANHSMVMQTNVLVRGFVANSYDFIKNAEVILYKKGTSRPYISKAIEVSSSGGWMTNIFNIQPGSYILQANATSEIGQHTFSDIEIKIQVEQPNVAVYNPIANSFTDKQNLTITGSCSNSDMVVVEVWQRAIKKAEVDAELINNETNWTAAFTDLLHGQIDFKIKAINTITDACETIWHTIFVDLEKPTVHLDSILGLGELNIETELWDEAGLSNEVTVYGNSFVLSTHADDPDSGIYSYEIKINDNIVNTIFVDSSMPPIGQPSFSIQEVVTLTAAHNKIEIFYTDIVGNVQKMIINGQDFLSVDYIPYNESGPKVVIDEPSGVFLFNKNTISLLGTCKDLHGTDRIELEVFTPGAPTYYTHFSNSEIIGETWNGSVQNLRDGISDIYAYGIDGLGRGSNNKASISVLVDTLKPLVKIIDSSPISNEQNYIIKSKAVDAHSGIAKYKVEREENNIKQIIEEFVFDPVILPGIDVIKETSLELKQGKNKLYISYTDVLNNVGTWFFEVNYIKIDISPPEIEINMLPVASGSEVQFDLQIKDMESGLKDYVIDYFPNTTMDNIASDSLFYRLDNLPMATPLGYTLPSNKVSKLYPSGYLNILGVENNIVDVLTVELLVYTTDTSDDVLIFQWEDEITCIKFGLNRLGNNKPWLFIESFGEKITFTTFEEIKLKEWTHICFSVAENKCGIWLNSKPNLSKRLGFSLQFPAAECQFLATNQDAIYYSQIRIWNTFLQEDKIKEVAFKEAVARTNNLVAHLPLTEKNNGLAEGLYPNFSHYLIQNTGSNTEVVTIVVANKKHAPKLNNQSIQPPAFKIDTSTGLAIEMKVKVEKYNQELFSFKNEENYSLVCSVNEAGQIKLIQKNLILFEEVLTSKLIILKERIRLLFLLQANGFVEVFENGLLIGKGSFAPVTFLAKNNLIGSLSSALVIYTFDVWNKKERIKEYLQASYDFSIISNGRFNDCSKNDLHIPASYENFEWEDFVSLQNGHIEKMQNNILFQEGSFSLEKEIKIQQGTLNLLSEHTFYLETLQQKHLLDGNHLIRVTATNDLNLTTTVFKEFEIDTDDLKCVFVPKDASVIRTSAYIRLFFNREMDKDSVMDRLNIETGQQGDWVWDETGQILTYSSFSMFADQEVIKIVLESGSTDRLGRQRLPKKEVEYTVDTIEANKLEVYALSPEAGSNNVSIYSAIRIFFSNEINNTTIIPNETIKLFNTKTLEYETLLPDFLENIDNKDFTFYLEQPMLPGTDYLVTIADIVQDVLNDFLPNTFLFEFKTQKKLIDYLTYSIPVFNGLNGMAITLDDQRNNYTNISIRQTLEDQLGKKNIGSIFWYDIEKQKWVGDMLGQQKMKSFSLQDGFFVTLNLSSPQEVYFSGYIAEHGTIRINMKKGLNLIGIPLNSDFENIKSLLEYIGQEVEQSVIVSYINRRLKMSNQEEELIGYVYSHEDEHLAISFKFDKLGGEAVAIIAEKDCSFLIKGQAWQD